MKQLPIRALERSVRIAAVSILRKYGTVLSPCAAYGHIGWENDRQRSAGHHGTGAQLHAMNQTQESTSDSIALLTAEYLERLLWGIRGSFRMGNCLKCDGEQIELRETKD